MKKKLLAGVLAAGLVMTGCGAQDTVEDEPTEVVEDIQDEEQDQEVVEIDETVELSEWEGEWNSVAEFIDADFTLEALEEAAEEEGVTLDEIKAEKLVGLEFPFGSMIIDGDTVVYKDGTVEAGEDVAEAVYTFDHSIDVEHVGRTFQWHVFETDSEDVDKYLLLMEVHGEETLAHFHTRIGNDLDELVDRSDWSPTFVRPDADEELIAEEIAE